MGKATRESYGEALIQIGHENENIVVLDADLSKSTKVSIRHFQKRKNVLISLML